MIKLFLIISFLSIITFNHVSSQNINCDCTISDLIYLHFQRQKTCTVKINLNIKNDNTTIISINKNYNEGNPNRDVRFLLVQYKTVYYIPKGLDVVFSNLDGMRFEYTKLKYVAKENLQSLPELRMFASVGNEIQFIQKDLFKYNTKIEYVSLRFNRITYIDPNVFNVIRTSLVQFWIDGNAIGCGLSNAVNNAAVGKVLDKLPNSVCANIENAPPLYSFWLKYQEGGSGDDCEEKIKKEIEKCDAEKVEIEKKIEESYIEEINSLKEVISVLVTCILVPTPDCPTADTLTGLLKRAKSNLKI